MLHRMRKILPALFCFVLTFGVVKAAGAQDTLAGVDLLYPKLAYPEADARTAIKKDDLRFIAVDRYGKDTPGVNGYPRLKNRYGTKFVRQPFRIIPTASQDFSFRIRARAYAEIYNRVLLRHLLRGKR